MSIEKVIRENCCYLYLKEERLDAITAPDLEKEIDLIEEDRLVVDMTEVIYLSSAGVRALVKGYKKMYRKGGFLISSIQEQPKDVLDVACLSEAFGVKWKRN